MGFLLLLFLVVFASINHIVVNSIVSNNNLIFLPYILGTANGSYFLSGKLA